MRWWIGSLIVGALAGIGLYQIRSTVQPVAPRPKGITALTLSFAQPQRTLRFKPSQTSPAIVTHGPRNSPQIALTFDADMTPGMRWSLLHHRVRSYDNTAIYQILNQTHTKTTFFLSGMWIEQYPDETRRLAQNPLFELENHSYSHPGFKQPCYGLPKMQDSESHEVLETKLLLKQVAGVENRYFRFPGGCIDPQAVTIAQKGGLQVVHWDVVGGDAGQPNPNVIVKNVLRRVHDGSIIILHSHGGPKVPATAAAVRVIIPALKARGYEFVKVSELLQ